MPNFSSDIASKLTKQIKAASEPDWVRCPIHGAFGDFAVFVRIPAPHDVTYLEASRAAQPITQEELDKMSDEDKETRQSERLLRIHLANWEGLKDDDGSDVPFNVDDAVALFLREDMRSHRMRLMSLIDRIFERAERDLTTGAYWSRPLGAPAGNGEGGVTLSDQSKK